MDERKVESHDLFLAPGSRRRDWPWGKYILVLAVDTQLLGGNLQLTGHRKMLTGRIMT